MSDDPSPAEPRIESIYDHPKYYDLLFGSDWKAEFDFLEDCFERYTDRVVEQVFEPACGTGRLLVHFAAAEYVVGGLDLNRRAIDYCNDRLERRGFGRPCIVGDMTDFDRQALPGRAPADAAFNTINSFRHLCGEELAAAHLRCLAEVIAPGGLYILGLHLLPEDEESRTLEESWTARRGHLQVNSQMWSKGIEGREEVLGLAFDIYTPTSHQRIVDEMRYFTYTAGQFAELLSRCREWELVAVHDFAYDVEDHVAIDETTEDVVAVLRRV